ncbi:hypothetical protein PR048_030767 [Dryococelus australis]|uniref:Uncharacterized protein n=1 Tax=Dryococelus australis TaxID=614101 RepID=A0ABQ9G9U6_9NEOP|nr:hypothetical protein PR048_030767 [Dryococelus australis]
MPVWSGSASISWIGESCYKLNGINSLRSLLRSYVKRLAPHQAKGRGVMHRPLINLQDTWRRSIRPFNSIQNHARASSVESSSADELLVYSNISISNVLGVGGRWFSAVRLPTSHQGKPVPISSRALPDFRVWESCRTMPLVGGFSRGFPVYPTPLHADAAPYSPHFTLIGSQDLAPQFLICVVSADWLSCFHSTAAHHDAIGDDKLLLTVSRLYYDQESKQSRGVSEMDVNGRETTEKRRLGPSLLHNGRATIKRRKEKRSFRGRLEDDLPTLASPRRKLTTENTD